MTGIPALSSGPELWITIHNHRPEPLQLHSGQNIGVLEVVTMADTPPTTFRPGPLCQPPVPERLSPLQQQQLNDLFREFSDVFSQGEDDLGSTPLLERTIETHGRSEPHSASPTGNRTRPFDGRRWRRSSRCWPAVQQSVGFAGGNGEEKGR